MEKQNQKQELKDEDLKNVAGGFKVVVEKISSLWKPILDLIYKIRN